MSQKKPHVFTIVLNWHQPDLTIECLESLRKISTGNYQHTIVVVDNGSEDDSVKKINLYISNQRKDTFKLLKNEENLGFVGGNNVGIQFALDAGADYLFILNNDTALHKNSLCELISAAKKYKRAGLFTPKIYFAKGYEFHKEKYKKSELGRVIWSVGGDLDRKNVYGTNHGVDEVDSGQYSDSYETDFATGAALFARREVFERIGFFNENYYLYLEDLEFSIRAKKNGFKIRYIPDSIIWHKVSQSSVIGGKLNDYFITRNRMLFGMRYMSLRARFALFRESVRLLVSGRSWQKKGVRDYYMGILGRGSWK